MSAASRAGTCEVQLRRCDLRILEVAALRAGASVARQCGARSGTPLPDFGRVSSQASQLALCVRPGRWLLAETRAQQPPGAWLTRWRAGCAGSAVVTELSSALAAFILSGSAMRAVLARGCRLDLDAAVFASGAAAATSMAQVQVILAALPQGMLLLTASSTAQHFGEWLVSAARPFAGDAAGVAISDGTVEEYL